MWEAFSKKFIDFKNKDKILKARIYIEKEQLAPQKKRKQQFPQKLKITKEMIDDAFREKNSALSDVEFVTD